MSSCEHGIGCNLFSVMLSSGGVPASTIWEQKQKIFPPPPDLSLYGICVNNEEAIDETRNWNGYWKLNMISVFYLDDSAIIKALTLDLSPMTFLKHLPRTVC